jgi:asparagine synthase (glutamine-hydrolysing)
MAGFTAVISNTGNLSSGLTFSTKNVYGQEAHFSSNTICSDKYCIEHFTHHKFANDKILAEDEQYIIGMEGVLLNLKQLGVDTQKTGVFEIIKQLFNANGEAFISKLKGEFCGFIYSKADNKWVVFANPTGSKRLFYLQNSEYTIFASDLREISYICKQLKINLTLDTTGAYLMLTYGYMLENITIAKEINRLIPGDLLRIDNGKLSTSTYFSLSTISKTKDSKEEILEKMDRLFAQAICLEFEKDKEYNYKHIATLSGGLDSRMTVLMAHKLGYKEQLNFTFSQSNYLDETISKQIASDYGHEFLFQSLDNGNYLKNIDKTVYYNDGLILYSGSSHVLKSIENINTESYGMMHTGQIGDAVIGSFLSKPYAVKPTIYSGAYSTKLINRIAPFLETVVAKYPTEELFKFHGRAFLAALNGNYYFDIYTQTVSPFLDIDFLTYCYSIPEEYKYKQKIYLEWIAQKHPEFAKYRWEKTGVSPLKSYNYMKYFDLYFYQRMKLKFFDRIRKKIKTGMNPFDDWFDKNPSLQEYLSNYYYEHISLLDDQKELKKDCELLYSTGNVNQRLQVLTLLAAIKLHFK